MYWNKWLENFYNKVKDEKRFINISKISDKVAVIIEPRKHPLLKYVIYNFMYFLQPEGWALQIFYGTDNEDFVKDSIKDLNCVSLYKLPYSNLNEPAYNILLTNSGFYKSIFGKYILIFQTDCILFSGNLDRFLKYDMIGAKWIHSPDKGCNGGLSIRNRNSMIRICETKPWIYDNEDGFFSYRYSDSLNMPSRNEKDLFSMETCWSENCCGMHKAYAHHSEDKINLLLDIKWKKIFEE